MSPSLRWQRGLAAAVWWMFGLAPAVLAMFTPRTDWESPPLLAILGLTDAARAEDLASAANRSLNLGLLTIEIFWGILLISQWRPLTTASGPAALLLCTLVMALGLVTGAGDTLPSGALLWPATALVLTLASPWSWTELVERMRRICGIYMWGSLIAVILLPGWALQPDYGQGMIPGLSFRLYGMSSHANQLGMLAFVALLLELHADSRGWRRRLSLFAATTVLLLAQSKSFFALGPLAVAIWWTMGQLERSPAANTHRFVLVVALTLALVGGSMAAMAVGGDKLGKDEGLETYRARTEIWDITLEEWRQRPLLGYGPCLWDRPMGERYEARLGFVVGGHSHNQYLQVLGQSGAVGLAFFALFLVWFLARSLHLAAACAGMTISLALALLVRGSIEPFLFPQMLDLGALSFAFAAALVTGTPIGSNQLAVGIAPATTSS